MKVQKRHVSETDTDRFRDLTVAIVDDGTPVLPLLSGILLRWKMTRSRVYRSDHEALSDIVRRRKPDIVFLNWGPSSADPLRFARCVRTPDVFPYPFLPLVVVWASPELHMVRAARDSGVDEFLAVPFSSTNLYERVSSIVDDRRGFVDVPNYFGPDRRRGAMARQLNCERRCRSVLVDPSDGRKYIREADGERFYLPPEEQEKRYLDIVRERTPPTYHGPAPAA